MFNSTKKPENHENFKSLNLKLREKSKKKSLLSLINKKRYKKINSNLNLKINFPIDHLNTYPENLKTKIILWLNKNFSEEKIQNLISSIFSNDITLKHFGVIGIRKYLTNSNNPKQIIFDQNVVPKLIEFAQNNELSHLQLESTWCLTNLCTDNTENIMKLIQKGIIEIFLFVAQNKFSQISEQAVWGLGNIAGDLDIHCRNKIIRSENSLKILTNLYLDTKSNEKLKNNIIWVFSNLSRLKKDEDSDNLNDLKMILKPILLILLQKFIKTDQEEIKQECIMGLSPYVKSNLLPTFASLEFLNKLKNYLKSQIISQNPKLYIISSILQILGTITSSEENKFTDNILATNFTISLQKLLSCSDKDIQQKVCWIFCNIAIGTESQKLHLISQNGLINNFIELVDKEHNDLGQEALWILCSLCNSKNNDVIIFLININLLRIFKSVLARDGKENKIVILVLEALDFLLKYFKGCNNLRAFCDRLVGEGLADKIEELQGSKSETIYLKSLNILESYFEIENDFPF